MLDEQFPLLRLTLILRTLKSDTAAHLQNKALLQKQDSGDSGESGQEREGGRKKCSTGAALEDLQGEE